MSDRKRLLNDLRVIDLRVELEKRNLDKSGNRSVLLQRLTKHLEEEGHDPATYCFDTPEATTPSKRALRTESSAELESEETPKMEDMIVRDDIGDEEVSTPVNSLQSNKSEQSMEVTETKIDRKREIKEEIPEDTPPAKKPCLEEDDKTEDQKAIENNIDAEDSINLDLGDDELLNEETDNTAKVKKEEPEDAAEAAGTDGAEDVATQEDSATGVVVKEELKSEAVATSENAEDKDNEQTDDKDKDGGDKKDKKDESKDGGARNLWVSGLSGDTRAKDLKQLCSKHGKVIGAKVVTNARTPGSRCYGYVTMASSADAENCIKNLHRTELHGRMISVEKAKAESDSTTKKPVARQHERRSSKDKPEAKEERSDDKEVKTEADSNGEVKTVKKEEDASGTDGNRSISENRDRNYRSERERAHRTRSRERRRTDVLSFNKILKERDIARQRERSRAARDEERRRRAAEESLRERERRQRQEKHRLELEREKLRAEREKIEREKNELLRLERERHRLEREKLELERLELKRAQMRLEEERRKRSSGYEGGSGYRKNAPSPPPAPSYNSDSRHKRPPPPPMMSSRNFEAPPPPRFDMAAPAYERASDKRDRDYKREYPRHVPSSNIKYSSNGNTNDDSRQPLPPGTRPKEPGRSYESRDGRGAYRPSPPTKPDQRTWNPSSRYQDSGVTSKVDRLPPKVTVVEQQRAGILRPVKPVFGNRNFTRDGGTSEPWSASGSSDTRYPGGSSTSAPYEQRYTPAYQPPPPGASYPDRYAPPPRDYRPKY